VLDAILVKQRRLLVNVDNSRAAKVWVTSRIASLSFQRVGAGITQSSMNRAYASPVAAMRSSRTFKYQG
jgi:hypothetical protein